MTRTNGRRHAALVVWCAAVLPDSMDLSPTGVALPAIGRDLSLLLGALVAVLGPRPRAPYRFPPPPPEGVTS